MQIAFYISFQQAILDRFAIACTELATYMHCDHHKAEPSTVARIELTGLVHINYCMHWILPLSWIHA